MKILKYLFTGFVPVIVATTSCSTIDLTTYQKDIETLKSEVSPQALRRVKDFTEDWKKISSQGDFYYTVNEYCKETHALQTGDDWVSKSLQGIPYYSKRNYSLGVEDGPKDIPTLQKVNRYLEYLQRGLSYNQAFYNDSLLIRILFPADAPEITYNADQLPVIRLKKMVQQGKDTDYPEGLKMDPDKAIFPLGKTGILDSVHLEFTIPYLSEIDSVVYESGNFYDEQKGFKFIGLLNDRIGLVEPDEFIIDYRAYNADGQLLKIKNQDAENIYRLKTNEAHLEYEDLVKTIKNSKADSVSNCLAEYLLLSVQKKYDLSVKRSIQYNDNIDRLVIRFRKQSDEVRKTITLSNHNPHQKYLLNYQTVGVEIIDAKGSTVTSYDQNLVPLSHENGTICSSYLIGKDQSTGKHQYFFVDAENKELLPLYFAQHIIVLDHDRVAIRHKDDPNDRYVNEKRTFVYDDNLKKISDKAYYDIYTDGDAIVACTKSYEKGLMDSRGNEIGDQDYHSISNFKKGIAAAIKEHTTPNLVVYVHSGFINTKGEVIVPLKYGDKTIAFCRGYIDKEHIYDPQIVCKDQLLGWVDFDKNAKLTIPIIYHVLIPLPNLLPDHRFKKLLFLASKDEMANTYGVVDRNGEMVVPFKYEQANILQVLEDKGLYFGIK